ncbi:MAG TPA: hypothetical protein VFQ63_00600, partial [Patescibacteria group bacterium]|nr:hypothetical protein [Patescibacteria group bacterium]
MDENTTPQSWTFDSFLSHLETNGFQHSADTIRDAISDNVDANRLQGLIGDAARTAGIAFGGSELGTIITSAPLSFSSQAPSNSLEEEETPSQGDTPQHGPPAGTVVPFRDSFEGEIQDNVHEAQKREAIDKLDEIRNDTSLSEEEKQQKVQAAFKEILDANATSELAIQEQHRILAKHAESVDSDNKEDGKTTDIAGKIKSRAGELEKLRAEQKRLRAEALAKEEKRLQEIQSQRALSKKEQAELENITRQQKESTRHTSVHTDIWEKKFGRLKTKEEQDELVRRLLTGQQNRTKRDFAQIFYSEKDGGKTLFRRKQKDSKMVKTFTHKEKRLIRNKQNALLKGPKKSSRLASLIRRVVFDPFQPQATANDWAQWEYSSGPGSSGFGGFFVDTGNDDNGDQGGGSSGGGGGGKNPYDTYKQFQKLSKFFKGFGGSASGAGTGAAGAAGGAGGGTVIAIVVGVILLIVLIVVIITILGQNKYQENFSLLNCGNLENFYSVAQEPSTTRKVINDNYFLDVRTDIYVDYSNNNNGQETIIPDNEPKNPYFQEAVDANLTLFNTTCLLFGQYVNAPYDFKKHELNTFGNLVVGTTDQRDPNKGHQALPIVWAIVFDERDKNCHIVYNPRKDEPLAEFINPNLCSHYQAYFLIAQSLAHSLIIQQNHVNPGASIFKDFSTNPAPNGIPGKDGLLPTSLCSSGDPYGKAGTLGESEKDQQKRDCFGDMVGEYLTYPYYTDGFTPTNNQDPNATASASLSSLYNFNQKDGKYFDYYTFAKEKLFDGVDFYTV